MHKIILLVLFASLTPFFLSEAWGQGKKGTQGTTLETTAQDYAALAKMSGVTGTIVSMGPDGKSMTLRVEYQVAEPTGKVPTPPKQPNINQKLPRPPQNNRNNMSPAQIQRELANIQRIKNPVQQQQRLMQLMSRINNAKMKQQVQQMQWVQKQMQQAAKKQQQQGNKAGQNPYFKTVTYAKEFQLPVSSDARVAKKQLGLEYDEKGNVKQYSPEELKKMQDDKLPGYKAEMNEVAPGLVVYVALGKADAKDKGQPGVDISDIFNGSNPPPVGVTNAPMVQAILILSEPGLSNLPPLKK